MEKDQIQYLPFNAINEYMLPEYRQQVITQVLRDFNKLPKDRQATLTRLTRMMVEIPGFRNSAQAPAGMRLKGSLAAFIRSHDFAAQILQGWSELHPELRQQVFELLKTREVWGEQLPVESDRAKMPGFRLDWPEEETYDVLDAAFAESNPGVEADENDVRLMSVWLVGRLPNTVTEEGD